MRSHLAQRVGRLLLPLLLAGCQETTDPQREAGDEQSADLVPTINAAITSKADSLTHLRFVSEGATANVFWFVGPDASGITLVGSVSISKLIEPATTATLSYGVFQCDASGSCTGLEGGSGEIPASDFTVVSHGFNIDELRLSTNTNTPDFGRFGEGGPISVEWHKTPGLRVHSTGVQEERAGGLRIKSHGTQLDHSAAATGSVIGFPIGPSQSALITEGHFRTIEIFH